MRRLIISVAVIFAIILVANSNQNCFSQEDLKHLKNVLHESSEYMSRGAKEENIIICIGATRAGKSTLINYLIDNRLKAEKATNFQPITISKVNRQSLGPEIGLGSTSKTTIPTRWTSRKLPEVAIWDAPGFDDNRGPVQDVTNAFYLYQLLQKVRSLKIVLVVDINDILHDNVKPFLSVLNAVEKLLGNRMQDYFTSIAVIFTKVPSVQEGVPVDVEFINEKLSYQFLSNNDMQLSQVSKDFVRYLIANNNHIAFFKRPQIGLVTPAVDVNIFQVIKNSNHIGRNSLEKISPSVSENSKLCLFQARETLYSIRAFQDLQDVVSSVIDRRVHGLNAVSDAIESENHIRNIKNDLTGINTKLHDAVFYTKTFPEKIKILRTIDYTISRKVEEHNLFEKFQLMEFVDKLLELKESINLDAGIQGVLKSSKLKVQESINSAENKLNSITHKKNEIQRMEQERRHQEEIARLTRERDEQERRQRETRKERKSFWRRIFG